MFSRAVRPALRLPAQAAATRPALSNNYATLREIEGRLKSIKNIAKITNTMKIVASTKLARAQKGMNDSKAYGVNSNTVFNNAETKPLDTGRNLLIVASSDKGLCGGIHSSLSKNTRRRLNADPNLDVVVLGEKVKAQIARSHPQRLALTFSNVGKNVPTFGEAQAIADQITQLETKYDNVEILYNSFVSAVAYEPATLPAYSEQAILSSGNIAAFESEDEQIVNFQEYALANSIYWALAEGHACEQSARRNAMDNASKNAGEMINKLQILYNRTRQAAITGELVEIITGASASEDA
ncbi:ATPase, F1 complex, gamma subunit domain-containing protein [Peziza echinospora]|nr:ATPase, F1 complex, gamma subunit domain-containing protein [Peziza echinospora]